MKKIYQNPEIAIVNVRMAQMIAASVNLSEETVDPSAAEERMFGLDFEQQLPWGL